jgi:pimeloyl-ACP methyl ester carboxylesterase
MQNATFFKSESADWVVFLHGIADNITVFNHQIESFKDHFNLLLFDLPGHGQSKSLIGHENIVDASKKIIEIMDSLQMIRHIL